MPFLKVVFELCIFLLVVHLYTLFYLSVNNSNGVISSGVNKSSLALTIFICCFLFAFFHFTHLKPVFHI
ncbi:membrane protein [Beggiatoa sp. PS]|nr:membrane protein [Beggiatoa sp. PS]